MALPLRVGILVRLQQGWDGYKTRPHHWNRGRRRHRPYALGSVRRSAWFSVGLAPLGFRPWGLGLVGERQDFRQRRPFGSIVVSIRPGVRNYLDGSSVAQDDLVASLHAGPNGPGDPVGHRR